MTDKEKELLLQDLCSRSPYRVMCRVSFDEENIFIEPLESVRPLMAFNQVTTSYSVVSIDCVKPYLRPMSSMTEAEREEYNKIACECSTPFFQMSAKATRFLYSHHLDYCDMIGLGLALEAPADMYKFK